jgi:hypothetical protein
VEQHLGAVGAEFSQVDLITGAVSSGSPGDAQLNTSRLGGSTSRYTPVVGYSAPSAGFTIV